MDKKSLQSNNQLTLRTRSQKIGYIKRNYELYLILVPGILFMALFKYVPLYGLTIAFKDFNIFEGNNPFDSIIKSPWVGFEHFARVMSTSAFIRVLRNTLLISVYKLVFLFPLPIVLAILINEVNNMAFKRVFQTVVYLPHFLSWIIISGIFISLLGSSGMVNAFLMALGREKPVLFMMNPDLFRGLLVTSAGWKEVGWQSIIYLAAITGIDPQLYESALVDGANKFKRIIYITIPGIFSTVVLLFILRVGNILQAGFEQVLVMYNPMVYDVADIIQTYVYRIGLGQMDFSLGTSMGLFNSVVAFVLIISSNWLSKRLMGKSIW